MGDALGTGAAKRASRASDVPRLPRRPAPQKRQRTRPVIQHGAQAAKAIARITGAAEQIKYVKRTSLPLPRTKRENADQQLDRGHARLGHASSQTPLISDSIRARNTLFGILEDITTAS